MPYCDDCLTPFPFDDSESCRCPSCRERLADLQAAEAEMEADATAEEGAMH
ncbi:hypothetical protein [Mesorhizobium sp. M1A.F.Ca.IN.022.07.1.1]|uniref:hypothetical protein n=1 Tax=Mesorhizobium sp. M1A.F.Ca.IN.022.07.1.1 TaxID=2496767 RepID=UPI0013DFC7B3|nr:hypothetical protein [Mesorhizobium sp. M1A.F.Ca.IN.022.07.1.1]